MSYQSEQEVYMYILEQRLYIFNYSYLILITIPKQGQETHQLRMEL